MWHYQTSGQNLFLQSLSEAYPDDRILLVCDGAAWHKSGALFIPQNIRLLFIPPATPEINPIGQIWKEIRKRGLRNEIFHTLGDVIVRLCDTIRSLSPYLIYSITGHDWIIYCFI